MSNTTTSVLSPAVQQSFMTKLLAIKVPSFIHAIPAERKNMPANGGSVARFRRYDRLAPALVPLGNSGQNPPSQVLTALDIDAKMSEYGTFVQINEQVTLQAQDPVLNSATQVLGISLRETEDILVRDMLASSASFINCVAGVNGLVPTEVTQADFGIAGQTLFSADAYTIMQIVGGEDRFGTSPIRSGFFAMASTSIMNEIQACDGFVSVAQYPSQMSTLSSEWGSVNVVPN